ncbi:MAG: hypothetical protein M0P07_06660 [Candidatus Methanomethylophilaceae archaeon]|nr:hypothetical protein [Candidatus Methanomethylophilaceae archaeon]
MSSPNITKKERLILHLSRFPGIDSSISYNVPFDLTQDGIASVLGISRAHACIELKKLEELNMVGSWSTHVKTAGSKRKAYYLLSKGWSESETLKTKLESTGVAIDTLLDMKRCDPQVLWEKLNPEDRDTFGLACIFRVPIPRKTLPNTNTSVIPTDFYGLVQISDNVKEKYVGVADPEKIRAWHSRAADWWTDNGDDMQEKLYHLSKAGRNIEACKLLLKNSEEFLDNPNDDLLNILKDVTPVPKYAEQIYELRANIALDCDNIADALYCANILDDYKTVKPSLIRAQANMMTGNADKAYETSAKIFEDKELPSAAIIAAKALFILEKYNEAETYLSSAYKILSENGEASHIDEILILRASIAYRHGNTDECLSYLSKARKVCKKNRIKTKIDRLTSDVKLDIESIKF